MTDFVEVKDLKLIRGYLNKLDEQILSMQLLRQKAAETLKFYELLMKK